MIDPGDQAASRRTEELFRVLASHSGDILSILDAEGRLVFNSAAAATISGFSLDELSGTDTFELMHPDDREAVQRAFAEVLAAPGARTTVRYRYRTKAGGWTWMEAVAVNHLDDPTVQGVVANSRDIGERVRAEEALRASEERLRTFLASCQEGFVRLGANATILESNDQLARLLGSQGATELLGCRLSDFAFPEDRAAWAEWEAGCRQGEPSRQLLRARRRDGAERWVQVSSVPLRDPAGALAGRQALLADVTEARALEARLSRAQTLEGLGTLAGGVAHDFNNLLVGILGGADLVRLELGEGHPGQEPLRVVIEAARRASALCRQLLTFAGRAAPSLEPLRLDALVAETADLLEVSAGRQFTLERRVAAGLPPTLGDATQLRQVLLNLVVNATEASSPGGRITVVVDRLEADRGTLDTYQGGQGRAPGSWLRLQVQDQGHGMPPEVLARIFDPFFSTKAQGRGLGLASTLGVVRHHGGCLRVESAVGAGTTFTILLAPAPEASLAASPRAAPPLAATPPAVAQAAPRLAGRALVVDDEPLVRRVASRILLRLGLEVEEACDGEEGAAAVEADPTRHALVLLDLAMPRLDGAGALARIRAAAPTIPVIMSSGFASEELRARLLEQGSVDLVEKPYDARVLGEACRRAMAGPRGRT